MLQLPSSPRLADVKGFWLSANLVAAFLASVVGLVLGLVAGSSAVSAAVSAAAVEPAAGVSEPARAQFNYLRHCQGCHGPDAEGIDGLGKSLVDNEFVASTSDSDLVEFVRVGRPVSDPDNTSGIDMPPKGGNPALTDEDLAHLADAGI